MRPFTDEIKTMAAESGGFADATNRPYFTQLAESDGIEDVWEKIENTCGEQSITMRFFIRELIVTRKLAAWVNVLPDYKILARQADDLRKSLEGAACLYPPLPGVSRLIRELKLIASTARLKSSLLRISRKDVAQSRERILFMQLLTLLMKDLFARAFDAEVAYLTNVFYPMTDVTTDSVRAARRPTTVKGRSAKIATSS